MQKIASGGLLFTYSCSQHISSDLFRKIVFGAASDAGREVRIVHQMSQAPDHPISIYHPEGEYLKGLVLHVD
jgi:23S rRNA (cytosine1962-C5)-methyltransferase